MTEESSEDDSPSTHVDVEDVLWQHSHFGVALSGGGVRASLFSLGSLLFLVDSGLNRRVSEISSVSGGSITNATVAQRCDFSTVTRDEFDEHAKHLASATVRGLVPKAPVVAGYGLLTALVVGIVVWSWPFALPWWADLALIGGLGFAVLLRGLLLAWLLRQRALRHPNRTLASLRDRRVTHVFCATDLNSSGPTYLMTRAPHILSSAWGKPLGIQKSAGGLPVATAVRASAAFPGGLPPVRLRTTELDLHQSAAQQLARYREMDFAEMGGPTPKAIYLSDGGVWNNIGTDWFLEHRRTETPLSVDRNRVEADRFVVIDASAPNVSEPRLWYLTFPWLAELGSIVRTLKAMSASTVTARIDALDTEFRKQSAHPTGCLAVVRLLRRVPESTAGPSPWPAPQWQERRHLFNGRILTQLKWIGGPRRIPVTCSASTPESRPRSSPYAPKLPSDCCFTATAPLDKLSLERAS